jgi:hypothetical protein
VYGQAVLGVSSLKLERLSADRAAEIVVLHTPTRSYNEESAEGLYLTEKKDLFK